MAINNIDREQVREFGISARMAERNTLDAFQQAATKFANYPGKASLFGVMYLLLKLNGEAGELADHVGKALRDDPGTFKRLSPDEFQVNELMPERLDAIIKELGDVLWYVAALADEFGIPLSVVAMQNLDKLLDRQERGRLQGSGDAR